MNNIDKKILGSKSKWFNWKKKIILIILLIIGGFGYFKYGTIRNIHNVTIAQPDSKDGRFLILTDHGAFKNVDSWMHLKVKSADIQGMAIPGQPVTLTVYGYRNGLFSMMPNVLKITK